MVLPSARPAVSPEREPAELPRGLFDALVDASLRLDGVEVPNADLRADEPAHRTAGGRASRTVVVRPGWGGRPSLR